MRRFLAFAICGLSLGACTSGDLFKLEKPTIALQLESEPAGAEAKLPSGASCKTPCTLPVDAAGELTVTYTLEGYQPVQTVVTILQPADPQQAMRADPNPVRIELEAAPQRPVRRRPAKKRAAPKKPAAAKPAATKRAAPARRAPARPAAAPSAPAPTTATAPAPAAPQSSPWPAPTPAQPQSSPWPSTPAQPSGQQ